MDSVAIIIDAINSNEFLVSLQHNDNREMQLGMRINW